MKTHRQAFYDKLDEEYLSYVSATTVTFKHLLMFADMLDEREADKEQCPATDSWADGKTFRCTKKANHAYPHDFGATEQNHADQFRDAKKKVEPTNERHTFPVELIARLRIVQQKAIRESLERGGECHPDVALCAVLSELAKAPMGLPNESDVLDAWFDGNRPSIPSWHRERSAVVVSMIRARIAPVLAAKDAELFELRAFKTAHESFLAQSDVTHRILDDAGVPNREPTMRNESRVLKMQDRVALGSGADRQTGIVRRTEQ